MIRWAKILVVDDSQVYRRVMATSLRPYCDSLVTAGGGHEALQLLRSHLDVDVVLCDRVMKDGDGFDVLAGIAELPEPRPRVLLVTAQATQEIVERALALGAVACLGKPTSARQILRALDPSAHEAQRRMRTRWRCVGKVHLLVSDAPDPETVAWDVYNLSLEGAFLETKGPIPVGSEFELRLFLSGEKADVRARVVRIQEPSWMEVGGIGVTFVDLDEQAEQVIRRALEFAQVES